MKVYTDGSCRNQVGGAGVVIIKNDVEIERYLIPVPAPTTNNYCELLGLHQALKLCTGKDADIYTDSEYALKCVTVWSGKWERNGWRTGNNKSVLNQEIIRKCIKLLHPGVKIHHVYAHNNDKWNDIADQIANSARVIQETINVISSQK